MQVFYGLWRSGVVTWIVEYAETTKKFEPTQSAALITYWAICELLTRPIVGHLARKDNRFAWIGMLFIVQGFLTAMIPKVDSYVAFAGLISAIGCLQGGTGGLFMTAAIDAVGCNLARYAYSVENTIDVMVAGGIVHLYLVGLVKDKK